MDYKIKLEPQAIEDLYKIKEFIRENDSAKKAENFLKLLNLCLISIEKVITTMMRILEISFLRVTQ